MYRHEQEYEVSASFNVSDVPDPKPIADAIIKSHKLAPYRPVTNVKGNKLRIVILLPAQRISEAIEVALANLKVALRDTTLDARPPYAMRVKRTSAEEDLD